MKRRQRGWISWEEELCHQCAFSSRSSVVFFYFFFFSWASSSSSVDTLRRSSLSCSSFFLLNFFFSSFTFRCGSTWTTSARNSRNTRTVTRTVEAVALRQNKERTSDGKSERSRPIGRQADGVRLHQAIVKTDLSFSLFFFLSHPPPSSAFPGFEKNKEKKERRVSMRFSNTPVCPYV